jgi:hypothetical protein
MQRRSPLPARRRNRPFLVATPLPARAAMPYVTRHGFGYSVFETEVGGISSELWVYVAIDAAVKFSVLKMRNKSGRPRKLSATGYVEWVLGDLRGEIGHACGHRNRPRAAGRSTRAIRTSRVCRARCLLRCRRPDAQPERRPHGIHRPQRQSEKSGRHASGAPVRQGRRRLDPCAAIQVASNWPTARSAKSSSGSASGAMPTMPANWCNVFVAFWPRAPRSKRCGQHWRRRSARCRWKPPTRRSMCWPTAGWCTRPWPVASGRAAATTSRAAPSASATSCRM